MSSIGRCFFCPRAMLWPFAELQRNEVRGYVEHMSMGDSANEDLHILIGWKQNKRPNAENLCLHFCRRNALSQCSEDWQRNRLLLPPYSCIHQLHPQLQASSSTWRSDQIVQIPSFVLQGQVIGVVVLHILRNPQYDRAMNGLSMSLVWKASMTYLSIMNLLLLMVVMEVVFFIMLLIILL